MIKTYSDKGSGRIKVFFPTDDDGNIISCIVGNQAVSTRQGFQFFVDDYVAHQIEKCEFFFDGTIPRLRVKDGETIEVPEKSKKEKEIERLEKELERLRAVDKKEVAE